jgi:hypothetical protein
MLTAMSRIRIVDPGELAFEVGPRTALLSGELMAPHPDGPGFWLDGSKTWKWEDGSPINMPDSRNVLDRLLEVATTEHWTIVPRPEGESAR